MKENKNKGTKKRSKNYINGIDRYIGIVIMDLNYPFFTTIATGAMEYANSKGYSIIVLSSNDKNEYENKLLSLFTTKDIKGILIAPGLKGISEIGYLFKLKSLNFPFVLLEDIRGIQANVVTIDHMMAVKDAVKHLIDIGHTKIIHFAGPPQYAHTFERIEGFKYAFSESTLVFRESMIIPIGDYFNECFENTIKLFKGMNPAEYPTAIVCFNDHQALAVMNALRKLGIRVPGDISIIGNDDIYDEKIYPVALTTIRPPLNELGKKAAQILIKNIESGQSLPEEKIIYQAKFIPRESVREIKRKL